MPLSEHEQRLLEQMERALHAEDPRLASTLRHGSGRTLNGRKIFLGALGILAGLAALLGGVITSLVVLGVIGFLLMLGGVLLIGAAMRTPSPPTLTVAGSSGKPGSAKSPQSRKGKPSRGSSSFMSRIEDRWRRRRDDGY